MKVVESIFIFSLLSSTASAGRVLQAKTKKEKKVKKGRKDGKVAQKNAPEPLENIISVGDRPYYLVDSMKPSMLKDEMMACAATTTDFMRSDFSIGHRGACMMYPEHTLESYKAAQLMGAGINECDVTFTKDLELVCRHAQCDLHTTTDVVARPEMNSKCTTPWAPGVSPKCCASDFTLAELKTLCAKMDSSVGSADTAEGYVYGGTAAWRTDLYQYECPSIPTHMESLELIRSMGGKFTPELKSPSVEMPFMGTYSQEDYAQALVDDYIKAGVPPKDVWLQSFNHDDVKYWVSNTAYGEQAVALDGQYGLLKAEYYAMFKDLVDSGVKIVAPPMWRLVEADESAPYGMVPSDYAELAKSMGLDIITWTLERTGPSLTGVNGWYWQTTADVDRTEGSMFELLEVLAFDVGILGIFSDWPATTTFYANCKNLALR